MCVELDSEAETPILPTCKSSFVDSHADYPVLFPVSVIHSLSTPNEAGETPAVTPFFSTSLPSAFFL